MSPDNGFDLEFTTQMFKSLGDESRLRILNLIVEFGEMCISDLELVLDFTQAKASRHLVYLKNSGLLSIRKKGQWTFYYLKPKPKETVLHLVKTVISDAILQNDLQTYKILYSNRELAAYKMTQRRFF